MLTFFYSNIFFSFQKIYAFYVNAWVNFYVEERKKFILRNFFFDSLLITRRVFFLSFEGADDFLLFHFDKHCKSEGEDAEKKKNEKNFFDEKSIK